MVIKMATIEVRCSKCGSIKAIKHGRTPTDKQRYQCKGCKNSFILDYTLEFGLCVDLWKAHL